MRLGAQAGAGYQFGDVAGTTLWTSQPDSGAMAIPAVFLASRTSGTGEGKGGSMHLAAPDKGHMLSSGVVATQIPVAVGAAFANRQLGSGRTAVVFFGDGAADAGVFWESLNAAALYRLPVIFVCEDNGYAVDTPRQARQVAASLTEAVSDAAT